MQGSPQNASAGAGFTMPANYNGAGFSNGTYTGQGIVNPSPNAAPIGTTAAQWQQMQGQAPQAPGLPQTSASPNTPGAVAGIGAGLAGVAGAALGGNSTGLGSLVNSLSGLGSAAVGATTGTQAVNAYDTQINNAINSQNQYYNTGVNTGNAGIGNVGNLLNQAQNYAGTSVGAQTGMLNNANQQTQQGVGAVGNYLGTALQQNQSATGLGQGANAALGQLTGANGSNPNYAAFQNQPGYQFTQQQGINALNRQAAASGNLYSTNTLQNLSNYTTGLASNTYQSYVNNLLGMSQIGSGAQNTAAQLAGQAGNQTGSLYNSAAGNAITTGQGINSAYNNAAQNTVNASGIQEGTYNNLINQAGNTGQGISNSYTNAGQANYSGVQQNNGSLSSTLAGNGPGLSSLLGLTNQNGGLSSLFSGINGTANGGYNGTAAGFNAGSLNGLTTDVPGLNTGGLLDLGSQTTNYGGVLGGLTDNGQSGIDSILGGLGDINFSGAGGQAAASLGSDGLGYLSDSAIGSIGAQSAGDLSSALSGAASSGAINLGSVAPGLGAASSLYNFFQNPTNPVTDINTAGALTSAGLTAAGLASAPETLGIGLGVAAISALVGGATKPNIPDRINQQVASQNGLQINSQGTLPSGNAVLSAGDLGVGAGTQSSKGSGQIYQINPQGSKADNTLYHWIGQSNSTNLENDAHNLSQWLKSGAITVGSDGTYTATNAAGQRTLSGIESIYNSTGGQGSWDMSPDAFESSLNKLLSSGAYSSGDAFGRGN